MIIRFGDWPLRCGSAGRVTAQLLLSFLACSSALAQVQQPQPHVPPGDQIPLSPGLVLPSEPGPSSDLGQTFTIRHLYHHGTHLHPRLVRKKDILSTNARVVLAAEDQYPAYDVPPLRMKSRPQPIQRLVDRRPSFVDSLVTNSRRHGHSTMQAPAPWTIDEVLFPDITDKETVLGLALMSSNAYVEVDDEGDWEEVGGARNRSAAFGWETDGLRGHVWADETNSTIVISLKGTSPAVFDGDGTTTNDKVNDNLFFSCCCAQQGQWSWHQVCGCATGPYSCNTTCVVDALQNEHRYYTAGRELYSNITELYPDANVWLTGHSLGGSVSSLLGLTYGLPTVTFEAVPEALPAHRLGLPVPPGADPALPQLRSLTGAFHFGHTADPIYLGTCNGRTSSCTYAGYAMESVCHTGMECVYDVVADKGWRVGIGTHKIHAVIHDIILPYDDVPECHYVPECRDCLGWKMYESHGSDPSTTTTTTSTTASPTSSSTRTRTATCQTPGWWGCLDKTTATATATHITTSSSTSTCKTPGWFGCKDVTTTADATTSTTSAFSTTNTSPTITTTCTSTSASTTSCQTPGRFWGCDDITSTSEHIPPIALPKVPALSQPTSLVHSIPINSYTPRQCVRQGWFGACEEWSGPSDANVNHPEDI